MWGYTTEQSSWSKNYLAPASVISHPILKLSTPTCTKNDSYLTDNCQVLEVIQLYAISHSIP